MVDPEEVPEDCGLAFVKDGTYRVKRKAPVTEAEPMPAMFIASLARQAAYPRACFLHLKNRATESSRDFKELHAAVRAAGHEPYSLLKEYRQPRLEISQESA
jgi:hypothetical protein